MLQGPFGKKVRARAHVAVQVAVMVVVVQGKCINKE
jgi:hypothetical protein